MDEPDRWSEALGQMSREDLMAEVDRQRHEASNYRRLWEGRGERRLGNGGAHRTAAGWTLGTVCAILTILALLGIIPVATKAEVAGLKLDVEKKFDSISKRLDDQATKLDKLLFFTTRPIDRERGP